jgi:hypothetical protein
MINLMKFLLPIQNLSEEQLYKLISEYGYPYEIRYKGKVTDGKKLTEMEMKEVVSELYNQLRQPVVATPSDASRKAPVLSREEFLNQLGLTEMNGNRLSRTQICEAVYQHRLRSVGGIFRLSRNRVREAMRDFEVLYV